MQFKFYMDHKVTSWIRQEWLVEADSMEDAARLMQESHHAFERKESLPDGVELTDAADVADSIEHMTTVQNMGNPTVEILHCIDPDTPEEKTNLVFDNLNGLLLPQKAFIP